MLPRDDPDYLRHVHATLTRHLRELGFYARPDNDRAVDADRDGERVGEEERVGVGERVGGGERVGEGQRYGDSSKVNADSSTFRCTPTILVILTP